jgi:hypothetical protein
MRLGCEQEIIANQENNYFAGKVGSAHHIPDAEAGYSAICSAHKSPSDPPLTENGRATP